MSLRNAILVGAMGLPLVLSSFALAADDKEKAAAVTDEDGKYFDAAGTPSAASGATMAIAMSAMVPTAWDRHSGPLWPSR